MSSTPQSIPLTSRTGRGTTLIAVGVLLVIAVAVTILAVTSSNNPTLRTSARTSQATTTSTFTRNLGLRQVGRTVVHVPGTAAAAGNTASRATVQANPDQQEITRQKALELPRSDNLPGARSRIITGQSQDLLRKVLPGWHSAELPGWLLRP